MSNKVIWLPKALKQLLKIDTRYRSNIQARVNQLADFPQVELDIKKLQGFERRFRLRIGFYRVLFDWIEGEPKIIEICTVAKRDEQTYN
ncbi:type II toxin-antitoxin system RelE family toxin [Avibacterium paragallinarum]|uniref:Type II toxin-antitoxin system RelE/ParE family toxin n=1 Tax=Avibacterium paragallinarum TaxID=728 RepID=A0ABU7QIE6_AVIPA|nr:type II toxin-antitoxin system RelE/ParE family toxin [Avibacterium paragallinarum]QZP15800.1 type II toxin-antitoxin system RelE/ParE family toxin [Avibacterium paragallinarum]WAL57223.1 type II toxin-antitoxin system RelE/ParE family toxin [Avibacterium paragallinarum]WAM59105.1 type II toxin-antitoxin system RelE/ParE family toxin [Avibacterium paragallinarum]